MESETASALGPIESSWTLRTHRCYMKTVSVSGIAFPCSGITYEGCISLGNCIWMLGNHIYVIPEHCNAISETGTAFICDSQAPVKAVPVSEIAFGCSGFTYM